MSFKGKKNVYVCRRCGHRTVTIDRDDGVTPFIIACKAVACVGEAQSEMYAVDQSLVPTHEWYQPTSAELIRMSPAMRKHVRMGGLALREIEDGMEKTDGHTVAVSEQG